VLSAIHVAEDKLHSLI